MVDAGAVILALRLRVNDTNVRIERGCKADWTVEMKINEARLLEVQILDDKESIVAGNSFSISGRSKSEIAHAIALIVVEALAPIAPELMSTLPSAETDAASWQKSPEESPQAESQKGIIDWTVQVGPAVAVLWPAPRFLWGGGIGGTMTYRLLFVAAELNWWSVVKERGEDYEIKCTQGALFLNAGVSLDLGRANTYLALGPAGRISIGWAKGTDLELGRDAMFDPGLGAQVGAAWKWDHLGFGVSIYFIHFFRYPRFLVDDEAVLVLGHELSGITLLMIVPL